MDDRYMNHISVIGNENIFLSFIFYLNLYD